MPLFTNSPFSDLSPFDEEFPSKLDNMNTELMRVGEIVESLEEILQFFQRDYQGGEDTITNAIVTNHDTQMISDWRWKYTLVKAEYAAGTGAPTLGDELTTEALNIREFFHTTNTAWGVDRSPSSDYPAGYNPKAIGGAGTGDGHVYNVPVRAWSMTFDGTVQWYFDAMGSHDGLCA